MLFRRRADARPAPTGALLRGDGFPVGLPILPCFDGFVFLLVFV